MMSNSIDIIKKMGNSYFLKVGQLIRHFQKMCVAQSFFAKDGQLKSYLRKNGPLKGYFQKTGHPIVICK